MLCSFVGDPARIRSAEMDRWCKDFDNWAICDTLCFNLFDRTPHAWAKVTQWSRRRDDAQFVRSLALIERAADDERNFVKKAVNMALGAIGRRNRPLNAAAVAVARRLADSQDETARWIGRDALKELTSRR